VAILEHPQSYIEGLKFVAADAVMGRFAERICLIVAAGTSEHNVVYCLKTYIVRVGMRIR
jgi:hypothetical protein